MAGMDPMGTIARDNGREMSCRQRLFAMRADECPPRAELGAGLRRIAPLEIDLGWVARRRERRRLGAEVEHGEQGARNRRVGDHRNDAATE